MTVEELIEVLKRFPQDMTVTVDGYEFGLTETFEVAAILVDPGANEGREFGGEHAPIVLSFDDGIDNYPNRRAVLNIGTRMDYAEKAPLGEAEHTADT